MRKIQTFGMVLSVLLVLGVCPAWAADEKPVEDITKTVLAGPGSIAIETKKDIRMSFGATTRIIPTFESGWDFGLSDRVPGFFGGAVAPNLFESHFNESGWVMGDYIRAEAKLHFNAIPKDMKWSFYACLEFDKALDTASVDARGGRTNDDSNFGLERLHVTYALPAQMRLHAGWDVWHLDAMDGASMVYGDDNPGLWLTGDYGKWDYSLGYFALGEGDFQVSPGGFADAADNDRSMYAGYLTLRPMEKQKVKVFYAFDRIRSVPVRDFANYLSNGAIGMVG